MPITLKKQAFTLPGPQTVTLSPEECQELYAGAKPVYDYAPVGAKEDDTQWETIDWQTFEAQFSQLCDQLEAIRAEGAIFFTEAEGSDDKNKKLYENQKSFMDVYATTIQKFKRDVLFHTMNTDSLYVAQLGHPLFFEEIKNALEIIVLKLKADVKKLKETVPYDIADKASALRLFDEAVREASVCDQGAHTKLISLRQDIRKTRGVKNSVALQLDAVFTRMASRYTKRARDQNLGWNLEGAETHAAFTIKNWAQVKGIFPEGMPYVQDRYSSPVTKEITQNEDGTQVTLYHVSDSNPIGFNEVDLNHNFQPEFDALFNAETVVAHLADHLTSNIDAIMGNYESAVKKAKGSESELKAARAELMSEMEDLMRDLDLQHQAGFFEKIVPIPKEGVDPEYWDRDYQRKTSLEVYYWAQVYACRALEQEGLVEGLERQELRKGLLLVTDGVVQWFENEKRELIPLAEVISIYGLEKNLSRLNQIKTFGLANALMETAQDGPLKDALKDKRNQSKLPYNRTQLHVDRPYFCFESIEDLIALKVVCKDNLYLLCLALEKAPRSMMQRLFYHGLTNEKTRAKTKQLFYDLNTSQPPRELAESGIPHEREDLSIYMSEAFLAHVLTLPAHEAADSVPGAWLGRAPKKIPQNFWLMKDYASLCEHANQSLSDLFTLYPPLVENYFRNIPVGHEGEALAEIVAFPDLAFAAKQMHKVRETIHGKPDQYLSLLDSLGTRRSPLIDDLFDELRELSTKVMVDYLPHVKSPILYDKLLNLVTNNLNTSNHLELLKRRRTVIDDFNLSVCMNPENKNRLVIHGFEDIISLWNGCEDKEKIIDALIALKRTEHYQVCNCLVSGLRWETHFSIAKTIIDKFNDRVYEKCPWKIIHSKEMSAVIFNKFNTQDELFAHLPNSFLRELTQDEGKKLITDLNAFEKYCERSGIEMEAILFAEPDKTLSWANSPRDLYALISSIKKRVADDPQRWESIFDEFKAHRLNRFIFPGLSALPDPITYNGLRQDQILADKMILALFEMITQGKGSADALIDSWGLAWEGAPSLDAMFTQESPYFEVYRTVHNRVKEGLKRVGLLTDYTELKPFASPREKWEYNEHCYINDYHSPYHAMLAIDTLDDLERLKREQLERAYLPPIQKIFSEAILNERDRKKAKAILLQLAPNAYRYLTQHHLDHAIETGDPTLIPEGFHPTIDNSFVKLRNHEAIHAFIKNHSETDYYRVLNSLLEIHPTIARRYLTAEDKDGEEARFYQLLDAITLFEVDENADKVLASIKDKVLELKPSLKTLIYSYPMTHTGPDQQRVMRILGTLFELLIPAYPEAYSLQLLGGIPVKLVHKWGYAGAFFIDLHLKRKPIRSKADLMALKESVNMLKAWAIRVIVKDESFSEMINQLSAREIYSFFSGFREIKSCWRLIIDAVIDPEKNQALLTDILLLERDNLTFQDYDYFLFFYEPPVSAGDPIFSYRDEKKKKINSLDSHDPNSDNLIIIEGFNDLFLIYKRLTNLPKERYDKIELTIYMGVGNESINSVKPDDLISNVASLPFFTFLDFLVALTASPELLVSEENKEMAKKITAELLKTDHSNAEVENFLLLPAFFELAGEIAPLLFKKFITNEFLKMINHQLSAAPEDRKLRKHALNFLLANRDVIVVADLDFELLYQVFSNSAPNRDAANEAFLKFFSQGMPGSSASALRALSTLVTPDNLESVMTAIDPTCWGMLLVTLQVLSPETDDPFLNLSLDHLETQGSRLTSILHSYEASRQGGNRLRHLENRDVAEPEFIHHLRHYCEHHVLTAQDLPEIKKLFAKHFGEVYKRKMRGQNAGDDLVTRAISTRPPRH